MVRLTVELAEGASESINPVRERELNLRGYKIPIVENLGASCDLYDCIDLSDNELKKLDGFPYLKRLKCLLLNNNKIVKISLNLEVALPALEDIILTNNNIQELSDLDALMSLKSLRRLSLLRNPVVYKKHYRLYSIHKLPQLRFLDFKRIRDSERALAKQVLEGEEGKTLMKEVEKAAVVSQVAAARAESAGPSPDMEEIKTRISQASSLEEVDRLKALLQAGQALPPLTQAGAGGHTRLPGIALQEEDEAMES